MVPAWRNILNHTHKLLLCKYIVNLLWLLQCMTKALKVHTASHLQHVFNGVGGARAAIAAASNVHSLLGESNLIAQTAATRPQTLLGLDLWVTSRVLFISFNPVSSSTQCRAQARTRQDLPSLQLKECLDCVSRWVLLYLHPDLLIFWPRVACLSICDTC